VAGEALRAMQLVLEGTEGVGSALAITAADGFRSRGMSNAAPEGEGRQK